MDVLKVYEDYDKTERIVYGIDKAKSEDHFNKEKRIYMLSQIDGKIPETMPYQITIRMLSTLLQIYSGDADKVIASLGDVKPEQEERLRRRIACAWFWIQHSAPDCALSSALLCARKELRLNYHRIWLRLLLRF